MAELKKRIVAGILAAAMVLTVAACDGDDEDPSITNPEDTSTTQPIGS